jgi:hypothetical protein
MFKAALQRLLSKLGKPRTEVLCTLFVGTWCALGSILARFAPNLYHRHLSVQGWAPRWHSLWVSVLFIAMFVWCALCAVRLRDAFAERRRGSKGSLPFAVVRAAWVLALGAFVWLFVAAPSEQFVVTAQGVMIHGEFYRALRIERNDQASRSAPPVAAWLERRVGATTETIRVLRGKWWPSRVGSYRLAMARNQMATEGVVFRHGRERVALAVDKPTQRGLMTLLLRAIHYHHHDAAEHVHDAEVEIDGKKKVLPLDPEWAGEDAFLGMKESPVVVLRVHRILTVPLAILAVVLLAAGAALARFASRAASRADS